MWSRHLPRVNRQEVGNLEVLVQTGEKYENL